MTETIEMGPPRVIELSFSISAEDSAVSLCHLMVGKIDSPRVWCSEGFAVLGISIQDNALERLCSADVPWVTSIEAAVVAIPSHWSPGETQDGKLFIAGRMHCTPPGSLNRSAIKKLADIEKLVELWAGRLDAPQMIAELRELVRL